MDLQLAITLETKRKLSWKKKTCHIQSQKEIMLKKKSEIKSLVNQ